MVWLNWTQVEKVHHCLNWWMDSSSSTRRLCFWTRKFNKEKRGLKLLFTTIEWVFFFIPLESCWVLKTSSKNFRKKLFDFLTLYSKTSLKKETLKILKISSSVWQLTCFDTKLFRLKGKNEKLRRKTFHLHSKSQNQSENMF